MEFFLPSILFLLVACGIVFFVLPRFGPLVLAIVSLVLLGLGIYNHYSMFESEYRLSSWQMGAVGYAPFIMIGALVLGIVLYLLYLVPSGSNANSNNGFETPKLNLPPAETATNVVTEGVNNMLRKGQEIFGQGNNGNRPSNNRGSSSNTSNNNAGLFGSNNNKKSFLNNINPFNTEGSNNNNRSKMY